MSCPDWISLAAARERGDEPAGWAAAVEHSDGCKLCRREALRADPLLVFRRMPALELPAAEERSEVEAMQQAVAALRAAERVAPRVASRQRFAAGRRWAAAAVLAFASLSVDLDKAPSARPAVEPLPEIDLSQQPLTLDGLDRPARVYHHINSDKRFSVTMVVSESIDV